MRAECAFAPAARTFSPAARAADGPASHAHDPSRVLVIGCGALARELVAVIDQAGLSNVDLTCLPATLHNRPGGIPAAVRAKIRAARPRYERIFIAYADCGTGGLLDLALADEGVERLPGAHCYEVYSGSAAFAAMTEEDPATFFLTDFLARNFERLVIVGLGLDRHPELLPTYFGNYRRLVHLAQTDDPGLVAAARRAARRLGLSFELRRTGYGDLATSVVRAADSAASASPSAAAPDRAAPAGPAPAGAAGPAPAGPAPVGPAPVGPAPAGPAGPAPAGAARPARPALAATASNASMDSDQAPISIVSLRGEQTDGLRASLGSSDLQPEQESSTTASLRPRYLRPQQGPPGSLRAGQDSRAALRGTV